MDKVQRTGKGKSSSQQGKTTSQPTLDLPVKQNVLVDLSQETHSSSSNPNAQESYVGSYNSISAVNVSADKVQNGAYSSSEQIDENNLIINKEIQKMGRGTSQNHMLKSTSVSQINQQSETSNLFSQSEKIGHSNPAEKRASVLYSPDALGKMTTQEAPHLDGCNHLQNVVSNNPPRLFGIPSIFSMPVDFNEIDGVRQDVNNPLIIDEMRLQAVQTDSTSSFKRDEIKQEECSQDRNSKNEMQSQAQRDTPEEEVITLSDQIVIPEFNCMVFNDLSAPRNDSCNSLMPPNNGFGRKRFNSSMHDMKNLSKRERFESGSNISTNISFRSDFEMERQKKREQEVLEKIQKIWTDMAYVRENIEPCLPSSQQVSISASLGLNLEGSPFFLSHQENQLKLSIENEIQNKVDQAVRASNQNRVEAIGDMILAEMGIAKKQPAQSLNLKPQFSSDFISFSDLQKEIDDKCLRSGYQVDEASEILEELQKAVQNQF